MSTETDVKKKKKVFLKGPIDPQFIADSIAKHQSRTTIGAHDIFLGQVRMDAVGEQNVIAIDYTAYEDLAEKELHLIREAAFDKYNLSCMHIYHSLERVNVGEICLFVFVSSPRRKDAFEASRFVVEELKAKVPIYGKEILSDATHRWKENT